MTPSVPLQNTLMLFAYTGMMQPHQRSGEIPFSGPVSEPSYGMQLVRLLKRARAKHS